MRHPARATAHRSPFEPAPIETRTGMAGRWPAPSGVRMLRGGVTALLVAGGLVLAACGGGEAQPVAPESGPAQATPAATATPEQAPATARATAATPTAATPVATATATAATPVVTATPTTATPTETTATASAAAATPTATPEPERQAGEAASGGATPTASPGAEESAQPANAAQREVTGASLPDKPDADGETEGEAGSSPAASAARGAVLAALRDALADDSAVHTWQDGPYTRQVRLVSGLVAQDTASNTDDDVVVTLGASESIVLRGDDHDDSNSTPVFLSGGELLTLPGGVLLAFDAEWDEYRINIFFTHNAIKLDRVSPRAFTTNAYFVETDAGMPSLDLANALASQEGVIISIPNWGRQLTTR